MGLPAGDFKSMNTRAKGLFDCGHVQGIQVGISGSHILIRASCLPEMKNDIVYKVMSLESLSYTIVAAVCGCKAGQGPKGSCKHVGALCYAFAEFCRVGKLPEFISSTQKLQEWNQPRSRRVDVIPVMDLSSRRQEILKKVIQLHNHLFLHSMILDLILCTYLCQIHWRNFVLIYKMQMFLVFLHNCLSLQLK